MTSQPEALRLARKFEEIGFVGDHKFYQDHWCRQAAVELRRLHAENQQLHAKNTALKAEIESLQARVQELGEMARENRSKKVIELERRIAEMEEQMASIGAGGVEPLRKPPATASCAYPMDAVLSCPHTVTHGSITLHFDPGQQGHNALAQLRQRLTAYDAAAKARELERLAVIEDLERLIPLINQGGTMSANQELLGLAANSEALELMEKFGLGIYRGYDAYRGEFTEAVYRPRKYARGKSCIEYHKDHPSPIEATRRAIGRAASEIENAMP